MAFSRKTAPEVVLEGDALTSAMAGIGMNFAVRATKNPNIEDVLLFASIEAMAESDLRVLAILANWFGVHHAWVNADRLTKRLQHHEGERLRAFWSAIAQWKIEDRRFSSLAKLYAGPRIDVLPTGADFQIRRHGEDRRFETTCLRVPANLLRDRPADILSPRELAKRHRTYRWRVMMGPSYRADVWAALEGAPDISAADLARRTYASFATAWQAKRDFAIAS